MKIGILTYHAPCNFGANLQAYCSYMFFESLGYEVKVINYLRSGDLNPTYCNSQQREAHFLFCKERLPLTEIVNESNILEVVVREQFDVIAIGADAVWNKGNRKDLEVFYAKWLWESPFSNKIKVICISPAFMGQSYSDLSLAEQQSFKDGLLHFTGINVRDEWTKQVINKEIIGDELIRVINPDPVFFLNDFCDDVWRNDGKAEIKKYIVMSLPKDYAPLRSNYIGLLKRLWFRRFKRIVNGNGYQLIELPMPEGRSGFVFDYSVPYPIDPLQWFLWLKNAKGFIGLRFHAIVSCLSSETPFYSLDLYGRVPKICKTLNKLGIHKFDHRYNTSSKIRNLLDGSGLEVCRMNGPDIYLVPPMKIFKGIVTFNVSAARSFKEREVGKFKDNIFKEIDSIKNERNV